MLHLKANNGKEIHWHVGERIPDPHSVDLTKPLQADGDELKKITELVSKESVIEFSTFTILDLLATVYGYQIEV